MDKSKVMKIVGVSCTMVGAVLLFMSGAGEAQIVAVVGAVLALAGVIVAIFKL